MRASVNGAGTVPFDNRYDVSKCSKNDQCTSKAVKSRLEGSKREKNTIIVPAKADFPHMRFQSGSS